MSNTKVRLLIDIGSVSVDEAIQLANLCVPAIQLIFVAKHDQFENLSKAINSKAEVYKTDSVNYPVNKIDGLDTGITDIISYVLNDETTALFFDRHFQKVRGLAHGPGLSNFYRYIAVIVAARYTFYKMVRCDFKFNVSTPHQIESWVDALVREKMGIKNLIIHTSPVPWRRQLSLGIRRDRTLCKFINTTVNQPDKDTANTDKWIHKVQDSYDKAIPEYERKRLEKNKGKFFNLGTEIIRFWNKPGLIWNKYQCYSAYTELSKRITGSGYVVYFLHYQPERTTLPEGYGFTQQLVAILALRGALPVEVRIVVKEHPSTFTNICVPSQRHSSFYKDIMAVPNVDLAQITQTSFDLVDNSAAVITISGTVGVEALLRGKPVVFMGVPLVKGTYGAHTYVNAENLADFLKGCNKLDSTKIIESTKDYLYRSMSDSVSGASEDGSDRNYDEMLKAGKIRLLKSLVRGDIRLDAELPA